jgi:PPOX class probable F420-dependent enzyme
MSTATPVLDALAASSYLSLTTFKKDGTAVATPVWLARDGDHLYVITDSASGKAKRLRNSRRVLLAPCDMRGRFESPQVEGTALVLDLPADVDAVRARIKGRYGLQYTLATLGARLRRSQAPQVGLEITLAPVVGA